ncbi:Cof-type HAD-IIB family hydrolase [Nitrosophilus kaiyonis]|uniref:Cof-type HAD-IIB family hydrolase n=1 Tax=Nitrosophilus kaiyonis TaxID=2930200 RepID=UPI00249188DE|nr:Cof-type HAD-IIB family hydrolase [Nitrosophilus kaiyonis]
MKLFITDLDKTFLRSDLSISQFSKEIWNRKTKEGFLLSIATARSLKKSLEFLNGLDLKIPLILLDGAMVATSDRKAIAINALDKEISNEIIDISKKFDIEPFIVGIKDNSLNERFLYPKKLNIYQQELINSYKNDNRLRAKDKITPLEKNLKIVYMGTKKDMESLESELKNIFKNSIETKLSKDPYIDCHFLTILHPKGDKSHALEEVLDYCNFSCEDLTVFGDSLNDIGMFKKAKRAVAVKNALEEVKKEADIILPHTNDEDAVAKYLSKI